MDVKFYQAWNGQKSCTGTLVGYDGGDVILDLDGAQVTLSKKDVAAVRLHLSF